eukprot:CAMPEP_0173102002 /NCGR_PEP_ID=MMETSP1102-20130122/37248_1 /TAXON_ID=49646 /ORGANISM="Geminigera sp., Strain Caron Lab Isolate" /LENGTH=437 /DNA_ID=CAMNT_0013995969 /DNA_START=181 /DNA_END=1491 /DNA_ORIENTATION=+
MDEPLGRLYPVWMRHPDDVAIAVNFQPPVCNAAQATVFECRIFGLVRGVEYKVEVTVRRGTIIVFKDEWRLKNSVFKTTIPKLSFAAHTIRVSVVDCYLGLDQDDSVLSSMIQNLKICSRPGEEQIWQVSSPLPSLKPLAMWGTELNEDERSEEGASWQGFQDADNPEGQDGKQILAICSCVTSKPGAGSDGTIIQFPHDSKQTSLQMMLIPSIERTITADERKQFEVRLYLGIDDTDTFWLDQFARLHAPEWLVMRVGVFKTIADKVPFNPLMQKAFDEGADFLVRVNDDTKFMSVGWISMGAFTLADHKHKNVGVVGPTCKHDADRPIMTHDMVHRTHLCIFKDYYPNFFSSWWVDDWISLVYEPGILSTKLPNWHVDHDTNLHGRRYHINQNEKMYLGESILEGQKVIFDWLLSQGNLSRKLADCKIRNRQRLW